jgi:S-formylglutathione hydrolase
MNTTKAGAAAPALVAHHACYGGEQRIYRHVSTETRGPMRFSVYVPPQARIAPVPVLYFLSGLTCNEETFCIKSHAQKYAAQLGLMLVSPDTSPREPRIDGDADHWDFGFSAGFYVDATEAPWAGYYRMYSYVVRELPQIVADHLPAKSGAAGICGHSMGGHGALTLALRNPSQYRSVSAFAPIAAPTQCPWGRKAFTGYLGPQSEAWREHDATELVARRPFPGPILIDQGTADQFLDDQLMPEKFAAAAVQAGQQLNLRMQPGYDHGYYFIQTFIEDHLRHHAGQLAAVAAG